MTTSYLFPVNFKRIGWILLIPSVLFGLVNLLVEYEPSFLNFNVPAIFVKELFDEHHLFGVVETNILNEIIGILIIVSSLLVAFSKEKQEDEFIYKIRLESLVWAVYVNYGVLIFAFLFVFGLSFLWIMIFNMFTILLFFIIRFNWQVSKLRKAFDHEE